MDEQERLTAPWEVVEHSESFVVKDQAGHDLAYIYFEDEPGRRRQTRRISREMARKLANRIARIPNDQTSKDDGNG